MMTRLLVRFALTLSFVATLSASARAETSAAPVAPGATAPKTPLADSNPSAAPAPVPAAVTPPVAPPAVTPAVTAPPAPASAPSLVSPSPPASTPSRIAKRYLSWDANIDGAIGADFFSNRTRLAGFGRVRGGLLWVRDPNFFSLGVTYQVSDMSAATLGLQGEWMNMETGLWGQLGPLLDVAHGGRVGAMGALGWSLFGVEGDVLNLAGSSIVPAVFAKLRIPIGIVAFGLRGR